MGESELIKTIGEFGSIGVTLAIVLWLIPRILHDQKRERDGFNNIIKNHLKHAERNEELSAEANNHLATTLQKLTDAVRSLNGKLRKQ